MICISGKFAPDVWEWAAAIPREGEIYTIQRVYNGKNRITDRREPGVDLVEVDTRLPGSLKGRLGWYTGRCAPVDLEEVSTRKRKKRNSRCEIPARKQPKPCHPTDGRRSLAQWPHQSSFHEYQSRIPSWLANASTNSYPRRDRSRCSPLSTLHEASATKRMSASGGNPPRSSWCARKVHPRIARRN